MDTAMRDLDQLRERGDETTRRKLGLFVLAGVLSVAAVFAMGIMVGRDGEAAPRSGSDPLAELALPSAKAEGKVPGAARPVEVRPEALSFPSTLSDTGDDAPLVEATVRAAEAEHALLSGAPSRAVPVPPIPGAPSAVVVPPPSAAELPAASAASDHAARLTRVAQHDPLVARALPTEDAPQDLAPAGYEGAFVLQVVSYDSAAQADKFATTLRARGHKAFVMQADVPGRGRFHRVRVGPFKTRAEAASYQSQFESSEHMHTILVANTQK
jgi:DedD protein